jgi:transglutaminase-like putative cysteine protease
MMRFGYIVIALLVFNAGFSQAPTKTTNPFGDFARQQDSIFNSLYQKRDIKNYTVQLNNWIKKYNQLTDANKKTYGQYLARAYYNLSCTYALLGNSDMALDKLEQAIQSGYTNYTHIRKDNDLQIIRSSPRFDSLLQPLRSVGDYLYILQKGEAYNLADKRELPAFTYQSPDNPGLTMLRQTYKLDSVAGAGNDISKVLNLLHWVHELIPHDGNHENPATRNALQMIAVCTKEQRGLNCRGLASVLNECYLSMGFASRLVTCLPKDSLGVDPDCHVINMVYVPSLKKWVWADPTNDAYIMNEKGELLDIAEVRERIIRDEPLILNHTANWNHRSSTIKEDYLYRYMAKNLYILQCPVNSEYDMETPAAGKTIQYIQLLPLDYFKQQPSVKTTTKKDMTFVFYNTNNPSLFWKLP